MLIWRRPAMFGTIITLLLTDLDVPYALPSNIKRARVDVIPNLLVDDVVEGICVQMSCDAVCGTY